MKCLLEEEGAGYIYISYKTRTEVPQNKEKDIGYLRDKTMSDTQGLFSEIKEPSVPKKQSSFRRFIMDT